MRQTLRSFARKLWRPFQRRNSKYELLWDQPGDATGLNACEFPTRVRFSSPLVTDSRLASVQNEVQQARKTNKNDGQAKELWDASSNPSTTSHERHHTNDGAYDLDKLVIEESNEFGEAPKYLNKTLLRTRNSLTQMKRRGNGEECHGQTQEGSMMKQRGFNDSMEILRCKQAHGGRPCRHKP